MPTIGTLGTTDWGAIALKVLKQEAPSSSTESLSRSVKSGTTATTSFPSSPSSSSGSAVKKLNQLDQIRDTKLYESLNTSRTWKLHGSTLVEKKMEGLVKECKFEQRV
ncbi:hypothetical protein DFQ29_004821, partial [Apophysomyces sp. BC1021]